MSDDGARIGHLIQLLARLPGLGPRSARRAALHLVKKRDSLLVPLLKALEGVAETVAPCTICGNYDTINPCAICADPERQPGLLCVVAEVGDLWALERGGSFPGRYHVLGGLLSPLDGIGPEDLGLDRLTARCQSERVEEVILALPATVDGQTTAHVIAKRLGGVGTTVSTLAQGVPVGGELDYLDDGTLSTALKARRPVL
ncbi:recombination mediator RecR [Roseospirillum parvum]|uniref:Recombination protein RecR n=1 Tax=Roseospirillum parvum TaxID=83401 RepID=A0A1G7W3S5_9PROT|nr:recombination mediator RecR [Roseospirillum parvum]SDG66652.1 DNA replication and repair protein RecR [Roseospirillum parvum]